METKPLVTSSTRIYLPTIKNVRLPKFRLWQNVLLPAELGGPTYRISDRVLDTELQTYTPYVQRRILITELDDVRDSSFAVMIDYDPNA